MSDENEQQSKLSRRRFLEAGSAVLVAAAGMQVAQGQQSKIYPHGYHIPGSTRASRDRKITRFWMARTRIRCGRRRRTRADSRRSSTRFRCRISGLKAGGWTRQVTVRDLPISKTMAGVEMRLISGGIRELHWHVASEWALMLYGSARITAVDQQGRAFVDDVHAGDLWLFPGGVPHSIQGLGEDGCKFLLVFKDGNFNEFGTFLLTDWMHHTPKEVLAKNFDVPESTFDNVPKRELFIFERELPRPLAEEKRQVEAGTGAVPNTFAFFTGQDDSRPRCRKAAR